MPLMGRTFHGLDVRGITFRFELDGGSAVRVL